jgi:hypothetical protein
MKFIFSQSAQYIILQRYDGLICYLAISSSGHSLREIDGLYLYHGCKHDQIDTNEEGNLKIIGVDMI